MKREGVFEVTGRTYNAAGDADGKKAGHGRAKVLDTRPRH